MLPTRSAGLRGAASLFGCAASVLALTTACSSAAVNEYDSEAVGVVQQEIQGGYVDDATSGVVGLGIFESEHFFVGHCSGTLIAPNLVLTARHCVTQISLEENSSLVECGETDFQRTRIADSLIVSPETERPRNPLHPSYVRGRSVHPAPDANDVCGFDIALLILERNIADFEATPIVPRVDRGTLSHEAFSASGYGLTADDDNASSGMRMRIDGNEVSCSTSECQEVFPELVTETEWLSTDAGVCSGDSGGPALDADGKVIGVASRGGEDCMATIYGDVAAWSDFIIEIALLAAEGGGYDAPFWTAGSSDPPADFDVEAISSSIAQSPPDEAEPEIDESDEDEVSRHGDVECATEDDCGEGGNGFAAEGGCSLASSGRPALPAPAGAWLLLGVALLGVHRLRRRG